MGGLTLYETLRILVPGVLTTISLDFALRAGFGPYLFDDDGGVEEFVGLVESTAGFTAFSLLLGLLLYMADVPAKLRIFKGDPARGRTLPSETLRRMLAGSPRADDATSLYFTLSDLYLPEEMRKRIYLFGSLYRVYVDLRVMLMSVFVLTVVASQLAARTTVRVAPRTGPDGEAAAAVAGVLLGALLVGLAGVRRHAVSYSAKHGGGFGEQFWHDVRQALVPTASLLALGGGAALLATAGGALAAAGASLAIVQLSLWWALELGPPEPASTSWRNRFLETLRAARDDVQYAPIQRLLYDVATVLPWLFASTWVNVLQGRDPVTALVWAIFVLPPVAIMSFRKHEERQLGIYREQSVWLEMHEADIDELKRTGLLPDRWK